MRTEIDGIFYDSPYPNVKFRKRESDGKVLTYGFKIGEIVFCRTQFTGDNVKILDIGPKYIEIDDGSGLEKHARLNYDQISDNEIYVCLEELPN